MFPLKNASVVVASILAGGSLVVPDETLPGRVAWLAGLLPVSLAWANSHGSFVLNLLFPWIFLAGGVLDDLRSRRLADRDRAVRVHLPLAVAGIAVALVSLVNPYGMRLAIHAVAVGQADWLRDNIVEFGSTIGERTREATYFWVYIAYLGAVVASLARGWRRLDGTSFVLLLLFGWMSTEAIRYTAWFAIAGTYVMAHALGELGRPPAAGRRIAAASGVALTAGIVAAAVHGDVRGHRIGFRNEAPMSPEALQYVRDARISGNVFNTFSHGDQLVHAFYPQIRVAIDSRTDGVDVVANYGVQVSKHGTLRLGAAWNTRKRTVILTTHNMDEADRVVDRLAIIDHGELLVQDTPESLKQRVGPDDLVEIHIINQSNFDAELQQVLMRIQGITIEASFDGPMRTLRVRSLHIVTHMPEILDNFTPVWARCR